MKIAVVGSREGFTEEQVERGMFHNFAYQENILVTGGARGVDTYAMNIARENNIQMIIFYPEWDKYGKGAGFIRNKLIVDNADKVIAFWDGQSKGTKHSIDYAKSKGKEVEIINTLIPTNKNKENV